MLCHEPPCDFGAPPTPNAPPPKQTPHSFDPSVMALHPDGLGGLSFSESVVRGERCSGDATVAGGVMPLQRVSMGRVCVRAHGWGLGGSGHP